MNVDPAHEAEFNEWYDHEHIPALWAVPGTLCARRFRDNKGTHRYLALYHLASPDVVLTPNGSRRRARPGPNVCGRISATTCASSPVTTCVPDSARN